MHDPKWQLPIWLKQPRPPVLSTSPTHPGKAAGPAEIRPKWPGVRPAEASIFFNGVERYLGTCFCSYRASLRLSPLIATAARGSLPCFMQRWEWPPAPSSATPYFGNGLPCEAALNPTRRRWLVGARGRLGRFLVSARIRHNPTLLLQNTCLMIVYVLCHMYLTTCRFVF